MNALGQEAAEDRRVVLGLAGLAQVMAKVVQVVQAAETEATLQTAPLVQAVEVEPRISGEFRPRVVVEARRRSPAQTVVGAVETTQGRAEYFSRASLHLGQAVV